MKWQTWVSCKYHLLKLKVVNTVLIALFKRGVFQSHPFKLMFLLFIFPLMSYILRLIYPTCMYRNEIETVCYAEGQRISARCLVLSRGGFKPWRGVNHLSCSCFLICLYCKKKTMTLTFIRNIFNILKHGDKALI